METSDRPLDVDGHKRLAWREALRTALESAFAAGLVTGGLYLVSRWMEAERSRTVPLVDEGEAESDDEEATAAAQLLGVHPHASADEIRAALRARLSETGAHPDHGGDAEMAKALIAAKNLLVERVRRAES
jgi:hypothetical protein